MFSKHYFDETGNRKKTKGSSKSPAVIVFEKRQISDFSPMASSTA